MASQITEGNVLTRESIIHRLDERSIVIEPLLEEKQIGSVSIDLRLDNEFGEFQSTRKPIIDPADLALDYVKISEIDFYSEPYALQVGHFVLGKTLLYVSLPKDSLRVVGRRTSVRRQGLMDHG